MWGRASSTDVLFSGSSDTTIKVEFVCAGVLLKARRLLTANRCGSLPMVILDQALRKPLVGTRAASCLWQYPPAAAGLCRAAAKEPSFGACRPIASPFSALATFRLFPRRPYVWMPTTTSSSRCVPPPAGSFAPFDTADVLRGTRRALFERGRST